MSKSLPDRMSPEIIGKWHALAERRRAHVVELYETGRWKHYYHEAEFVTVMRETVQLAKTWSQLAQAR